MADYALDPGTYYIVANDFGEDAAGTTLNIQVEHGSAGAARGQDGHA